MKMIHRPIISSYDWSLTTTFCGISYRGHSQLLGVLQLVVIRRLCWERLVQRSRSDS
ncbi:hypothetical protein [Levilactobacillus sp. N40-8-2]|uniref:hypothetical protein n=1 Tax=Levilactobacillus muriae TaxID=3238987 RepID=UPI0038B377BE